MNGFIAAGYLYKRLTPTTPNLTPSIKVQEVCSISSCIAKDFDYWAHNDHWLFDSPVIMQTIAQDNTIDLSNCRLFYYEVYEHYF